jgi:flagellar basal-body rod protein FlgG
LYVASESPLPLIERQWTDYSQGTLISTGKSLDLAITGKGFFTVDGPNGPLYTRNGNFRMSPDGTHHHSGWTSGAGGGRMATRRISIRKRLSTLTRKARSGRTASSRGNLVLVEFGDESLLTKAGSTYFKFDGPNPALALAAEVHQGSLESSNVPAGEAAVRLVSVMRQFEMLQRAMTLGGEMNRRAVEEVAKGQLGANEMIRALYSAGSGMAAQQMNIDNIAHNLANANTTGFKMRRAQFQDLLYQNFIQPGAAAGAQTVVPSGLQIGLGTRPASNEIIFAQGNFAATNNPLDVVVEGRGFFPGAVPNGETAYTRSGAFHLDRDGNLVTGEGNPLEPQITIPQQAQSVTIARDGTVSYVQPGQSAAQVAGQIQLANFTNPAGLNSLGGSLFAPTDASGRRPSATREGRKAWGRCCKAISSNRM